MKLYHIIYQTTNLINNKIYVGKHSTYNLDDGYMGSSRILRKAINKYGKSNFKTEVIFYAFTEECAYLVESLIVNEEFVLREDTYNLKIGGLGFSSGPTHLHFGKFGPEHNCYQRKASEETKLKMSLSRSGKGHYTYGMSKKEHPLYGRKASEQTKENLSKAKSKENHPFYGKTRSDETKLKMSVAKLGYKHTEESKLKMKQPKEQVTCPHCNKTGGLAAMKRWHFESCKLFHIF